MEALLRRDRVRSGSRLTPRQREVLQLLATCKLRARLDGAEEDFLRAVQLYASEESGAGERHDAQELKARIGLAVIRAQRGEYDIAEELLDDEEHVVVPFEFPQGHRPK